MSNIIIDLDISPKGIKDAIKQLEYYRDVTLPQKTKRFLEALADVGIKVARASADGDSHHFDDMVVFEKVIDSDTSVTVVGRNDDLSGLHVQWYDGKGIYHEETISPILALEYGTAGYAIKGHKGTAAVTGNHVNDTSWYYYESLDENGKPTDKHYATAEEPHTPMYDARMEMVQQIRSIAKKIF